MIHHKTKFIAVLAFAFLALSVVAFVGTQYMLGRYQNTLKERLSEQARAEAHRGVLNELARTVEESAETRRELESRVISEAQVIDLLALIEAVGKEQGIILTTDSITVEPLTLMFETLSIELSAEGRYGGIMQVLAILESLPYQSAVESVAFTLSDADAGAVWTGAIGLSVTKFVNN